MRGTVGEKEGEKEEVRVLLLRLLLPHHFVGGHQAAQHLREGPLRLQAGIEVTQVKEQQRNLIGAGDPGAQSQHTLHEVGHRRHPAQLPEHHHRRLQDTAWVASLNPTSPLIAIVSFSSSLKI